MQIDFLVHNHQYCGPVLENILFACFARLVCLLILILYPQAPECNYAASKRSHLYTSVSSKYLQVSDLLMPRNKPTYLELRILF